MEQKLQALIDQSEEWRILHKRSGRQIEAMAAAIRSIALKEALDIIKNENVHKR
jgi:hypothetical protein